jgi:hypothetical protein
VPRYSIGAEFLLNADDADEAGRIVGNFVDTFPAEVGHEAKDTAMDELDHEEPDVILQGPAEEQ